MTLFFGGELLSYLHQTSFGSGTHKWSIESISPSLPKKKQFYWTEQRGLLVSTQRTFIFPPQRKILMVASLAASPAWYALHTDICVIATKSQSEKLCGIARESFQRVYRTLRWPICAARVHETTKGSHKSTCRKF